MRLLIVQTGIIMAPAAQRIGGAPDLMFLDALGLAAGDADIVRVFEDEVLPPPARAGGILVTGSTAMVTGREPWSERTALWLRQAVGEGRAILGVCYGHQLLAHALGGVVADNPRGPEYGVIAVNATPGTAGDPLLGGLSRAGTAFYTAHYQSVIQAPPGAEVLAASVSDDHQAFRVGERAWGLQFHPEFTAPVMAAILEHERPGLAAAGLDIDARLAATARAASDRLPERNGRQILRQFRQICGF